MEVAFGRKTFLLEHCFQIHTGEAGQDGESALPSVGLFDGPGAGAVDGSCAVRLAVAFVLVVLVIVLVVVVFALVSEVASSSASTPGAAVLGLAGGVMCGGV